LVQNISESEIAQEEFNLTETVMQDPP